MQPRRDDAAFGCAAALLCALYIDKVGRKVWYTSAFFLAAAQILFLANFFLSIWAGKRVLVNNPWHATTLEWETPCPTGHGNFGPELPVVHRWAFDYSAPGAAEDIELFGAGWTYDHFYPLRTGPAEPTLEGWICLAMLLALTRRLRDAPMRRYERIGVGSCASFCARYSVRPV
jgi:hypothetical protein